MGEECARPIKFVDWRGVSHDLRELWSYVNGPASSLDLSEAGAGVRDARNDGKTPEDFQREVNEEIRRRRAGILASAGLGGGGGGTCNGGDAVSRSVDPRWLLLDEGSASELTLDEVLAVRMCTRRASVANPGCRLASPSLSKTLHRSHPHSRD